MTAKDRKDYVRPRRRFRKAVDGAVIRRWYARMLTAELARRTGLTVKQIENYVYRHNTEQWARKLPSLISELNRLKGKMGGRRRKKIQRKKADTFFLRQNMRYFAAETTTHADEYPSRGDEEASEPLGKQNRGLRQTSEPLGKQNRGSRQPSEQLGNQN